MKYLVYLIIGLIATACNGSNSSSNNYASSETTEQQKVEDTDDAERCGYNKGYDDGYSDGYGWLQHGVSYNASNTYQTDDAQRAYKSGYDEGYNNGYDEGEALQKSEREKARLSDWHNWEDEDVDGLYVYLDGVEDDDVADYVARENYEGEYIREGWKYFAKISHTWGEYEVTLGERVCSNLYKIRGSDIYIHFKWGLPDVSSGDEGVLDWSGTFSSFYKKPS